MLENSTIIGQNIPLRIVRQSNSNQAASSTSERGNVRVRRKSIHNVIEKRYRSSINERIDQLKEIVVGQEGKVGADKDLLEWEKIELIGT